MNQVPRILKFQEEDAKKMLACGVHLGSENLDTCMQNYVTGKNENGFNVIDIRKTWNKLLLAARVIAAVENPQEVCAIAIHTGSGTAPIAQRAVMKFSKHINTRAIVGRFTPGTFTNQIQKKFFEPRVLIVSDPIKDYQPILEASYVNIPVIAFCDTNANLRNVDIVIPCKTDGKYSIALMYWMLAREVMRLRDQVPRDAEWDVMVDMFVHREVEEAAKNEETAKTQETTYTYQEGGDFDKEGEYAEEGQTENWGDGGNWTEEQGGETFGDDTAGFAGDESEGEGNGESSQWGSSWGNK